MSSEFPLQPLRLNEERFEQALAQAFERAGWSVELQKRQAGHEVDLLVENAQHRYVVEIKSLRVPRRSEAKAFLAAAYLQARTSAEKLKAQPLPIFAAPSISRALAKELSAYAADHFPREPWGFVDAERVSLHGPGLEDLRIEPSLVPKRVVPVSRFDPFSDLNQWMLKVLLAPKIEPKYLAESLSRAPIRNASMLAEVAGVSVPSAARFVAHFRKEGFLDDSRSLRLVQVQKLMESWRVSIRPSVEVGVRWLLPPRSPADALEALMRIRDGARRLQGQEQPRLCLGLFAACDALNLGFVEGAPRHLEVDSIEHLIQEESDHLQIVKEGERVDFWVREPRFPQSVFRGRVWPHGLPCADALQCWLEVKSHPARGLEQAEYLEQKALSRVWNED